jgi:chemotaxis response regulator CheB
MSEKRVLLIESGQFIGGVIHSLFERHERLSVTVSSPTSSQELLKAVVRDRPDIVVIDDTVHTSFLGHLLRHMQICDGMRVVVVNTDSNRLTIYDKQQVDVTATADLFALM